MSRKFGLTKPRREPLRRKQITMKPQQIKNEVEKGCGEKFKKGLHKYICSGYNNFTESFILCPSCLAKLSILTEYDKSIKEMIEELEEHKFHEDDDISFIIKQELLSNIDWLQDHKECDFKGNNLILMCKELLSKIGDNSELGRRRND